MEVPFVDLGTNYDRIQEEIDGGIRDVIDDTQFIGGNPVEEFESSFAKYVGCNHAVAVNSGTDAIRLSLEALGIGEGDEVITVSHTFVSSVDGIVHNDARPRFVDIDPETYTMDPSAVAEEVTEDTTAILPVHLYGQSVDMDPIHKIAEEHDLAILEDTCQAHGARYKDRRCGTLGDVACYSFYPSKNLGAFGDAGMAVTDDPELAQKLRGLREYGATEKYRHESFGYNSRMDTMQAAVLNAKLPELDGWNRERREAAAIYNDRLADLPIEIPATAPYAEHIYHLYVVRAGSEAERDELQDHLDANGIGTGIHYPIPVHEQPSYRSLPWDVPDLPTTESTARRILSLPMYPEISKAEVEYVSDAVRSFYD